MAPISSTELTQEDCDRLLALAREAIRYGLDKGSCMPVETGEFPESMQHKGACFVTLHEKGNLRGCIGTLQPYQPLVSDVVEHAHDAAFRDPRFPPLREEEFDLVDISISVLGEPTTMQVKDEEDLCDQLEPGVDGVILQYGSLRGTFLPNVWETLPDCREFVRHLKLKAGLQADFWSDEIEISRYRSHSFGESSA